MSRITKTMAEEISKAMTEKKQQKIQTLREELYTAVRALHDSTIPLEVKEFSKKHPDYIKFSNYISLGYEFSYLKVSTETPVICDSSNSKGVIDPHNLGLKPLIKKLHTIYDKEKSLSKLQSDIKEALISLRTVAKVRSEFPEAAKHIPEKKITTALAVNLTDIKNRL